MNALVSNTIGNYNTAIGTDALLNNNGSSNVGLGVNAGKNLTTGSGNVCIGATVLGVSGESNTTRIGNIYSSVASGRAVYVNSDNKIGTLASTRRVKRTSNRSIKPVNPFSHSSRSASVTRKKSMLLALCSVGLVAEEVAEVDPNLVTPDRDGKPETVRYDAVNAMLLNEFLKEHKKVQNLEATVAQQQKGMEVLTTQLNKQAAQIQKVSAQLEASKPAPQTVKNTD